MSKDLEHRPCGCDSAPACGAVRHPLRLVWRWLAPDPERFGSYRPAQCCQGSLGAQPSRKGIVFWSRSPLFPLFPLFPLVHGTAAICHARGFGSIPGRSARVAASLFRVLHSCRGGPLMPTIEVRPFRRSDRDQLTHLVNSHAEAVVPGMGVSVSTVLSSLERQPGEFIEDPWVQERMTLVAEQADRIAAAAHLLRYFADERAGNAARDVGEIHWLLFWPEAPAGNPCWPDAADAAEALITACIRQLERWGVKRQHAGGGLPVPGDYGVPEQLPDIRAPYELAGFAHAGHTEILYLARVGDLPRPARPPIAGLSVRRSVGMNGTRLSAVLGDDVIGTSKWRLSTRASGCPGTADGPISATF